MGTERVRVQVTTMMSNLPPSLGYTNTVLIDLRQSIEELIQDGSETTLLGSYMDPNSSISRFFLRPRSFSKRHLSQLLRYELNRDIPFCRRLAEDIALCRSRVNHRRRPFLMSVYVAVIKEVRFIVPVVSVPLRGDSVDVFQRLLAEERVESIDSGETCSICIDNLSESTSENHDNIIQMPNCLHLFHQDCIFEWLADHNSCPLCRRVPYED